MSRAGGLSDGYENDALVSVRVSLAGVERARAGVAKAARELPVGAGGGGDRLLTGRRSAICGQSAKGDVERGARLRLLYEGAQTAASIEGEATPSEIALAASRELLG